MKETAISWWRQLAPRERQLISWGATGLLAALCYAYLWQPITVERNKLRTSLPQLRVNAAQMQRQAEEVSQLKTTVIPAPHNEAIKSAISQAANESGFDSKTLQVNLLNENRANIALAAVSFDAWTNLVANLQKKGMRLESCTVEALPEQGMASVQGVVTTGA